MGILRGIKKISPIGWIAEAVSNINDEGDIVDGIKRTVKEDITEDNLIAAIYNAGKNKGYREGQQDGYIRCSEQYEEKLRKQADSFFEIENKWKAEKAEYDALLDECERTIAELEAQVAATNSDEYKQRLINVRTYQRKLIALAN